MIILNNIQLQQYNTFSINAVADNFYILSEKNDFNEFAKLNISDYIILSGGSNILFTKEKYKNIVYIDYKEIQQNHHNTITVASGVEWDYFVKYCIEHKLYGLENLAKIPGKCGAAPIQNIGAYGVEQADHFVKLQYFDIENKEFRELTKQQCNFDYRYSIFKDNKFKNNIITNITYRLNNTFKPNLNYKDLAELEPDKLTPIELYNKISNIRNTKLPSVQIIGNAGSFFKNPVVTTEKLKILLDKYPKIPYFSFRDNYKLSAAWLIENAGFKGQRLNPDNDAAVYENHSLILVNHGNANGNDILELSNKIINTIYREYNVKLIPEVNIF